jgi:hypothetical protein
MACVGVMGAQPIAVRGSDLGCVALADTPNTR